MLTAAAQVTPDPVGVIGCAALVLLVGKGIWILIRREDDGE